MPAKPHSHTPAKSLLRLPLWPRLLLAATLSILAARPVHAQAPGTPDSLNLQISPVLGGDLINSTMVQPDGKTLIGGRFDTILGVTRNNIARLNADGTLDSAFNPKAEAEVMAIALQPDGKVLVGGKFSNLQPNGAASVTFRRRIARLNADGTLDATFDPNLNTGLTGGYVRNIIVQPDGKILIAGDFDTVKPNGAASTTPRNNIARLNADGSLDTTFDPNASSWIYTMALQTDGKILIGGQFSTLQPNGAPATTARSYVARLNADGSLDTAFDPKASGHVYSLLVQPDGKILIGGGFTQFRPNGAVLGTTRNSIARLNADGTLDIAFDPNADVPSTVYTMALQADGSLLLGGTFIQFLPNGNISAGARRNRIARLLADGTLDPVFDPNATDNAGSSVVSLGLQPDGKVLMGGTFTNLLPNGAVTAIPVNGFARLYNSTATQTFSAPSASQLIWTRGGTSPVLTQALFQQSLDGGTTWTPLGWASPVAGTSNWQLSNLNLPSGVNLSLRALGFTSGGLGNGSSGIVQAATTASFTPEIAVEQPLGNNLVDGSATVDFDSVLIGGSHSLTFTLKSLGTGNLTGIGLTLGGNNASEFSITESPATTVAGPAGSTTFTVRFSPLNAIGHGPRTATLQITSNDADENPFNLTFTGFGVSTATGAPNLFNANVIGSKVNVATTQPDGRTVIAGNFTSVLGVTRNRLARLNADDTLDTTFNPNADAEVTCLALQPDGKLLIGGVFTTLQPNGAVSPTTRNRLARLNADGSLDTTFNPNANADVNSLSLLADGSILAGGAFTSFQPNGAGAATTRNSLALLTSSGTVDKNFNPNANGVVNSITVQTDGDILIGGAFTSLQPNGAGSPTTRNRVARLNSDGSLDTAFNPNAGGTVNSLLLQPDTKILLGGAFTTLQPNGAGSPSTRNRIARLNSDGSLDTTFNPNANGTVNSLALQADGKVLLGGTFTNLQPTGAPSATTRNRIARLTASGTLDTLDPSANAEVRCLVLQPDGAILLGGSFLSLRPNGAATATSLPYLARLNNDSANSKFTTSASLVQWERGGTAPEVSRVTFEQSLNGGSTWTPLGNATRQDASANWQLSGLSLPGGVPISLRARGFGTGGYLNGSSTLIEAVTVAQLGGTSFPVFVGANFTVPEQALPAVSGPTADPDSDGISNLLEYAFHTDPRSASSRHLPTTQLVNVSTNTHVGLTYTRVKGGTDLTFTPEFSALAGSGYTTSAFTVISTVDNADGSETVTLSETAAIPGGSTKRFVRLRVTQN